MIKKLVRQIFFDPVKARIAYDVLTVVATGFVFWISFYVTRLPVPSLIIFLPLPFEFIVLNSAFGMYTKLKTSPAVVKFLVLGLALFIPFVVTTVFSGFSLVILLTALFTWVLVGLPRFLFNFNSSNNKNYLRIISNTKLPILVVGGAGYIGTYVVEKLLQKGHRVRVFDKFVYGKKPLKDLQSNKNLEIIEGDTSDLFKLTVGLDNTQAVIHLAGLVGDPACAVDSKMTQHINIVSTRMLKETVKAFRIPRFVFASSCSVYGTNSKTVSESDSLHPVSLYARTKIDSENELLKDTFDEFHPTVLRFATVFGHSRRMRFDLVVNLFTAQAWNNGIITVTGSDQWRPFIHVTDVAEAVIKAATAPLDKVSRQIFNVGDNSLNITIGDLAYLVADVVKKDRQGRPIKVKVKNDVGDRRNYSVSFEKIKKTLGFNTSVTLEEGIREMYMNFKKHVYRLPYTNKIYSNFEMTKEIQKEFYSKNYQKSHFSLISEA